MTTTPNRLMVPCDCVGTCSYLVIDRWDHEDGWDDEFYADIYVRPGTGMFRWRIKQAWKVLLGQQLPTDMTIQREQMVMMRDWLNERLEVSSGA